uniref:Uncharacterized protein n=1 Tax=Panagrolaimus sp. ES5 TaxID=591445 RepID=A0AC34GSK9_9BILA
MENNEFCAAYENVCFRIPNGEPDQPATRRPSSSKNEPTTTEASPSERISESEEQIRGPPPPSQPKKDYTQFCKEYKQRFLYVCPDPFRFGQRAAVFCPIYSERCHVPVPEKPILPTERPRTNPISEALTQRQRACTQYRSFAITYCNNPFALQSYNVREGCAKYRRWCTRRSG